MESTILFGNGVNLLDGGISWNKLLMDLSKKYFLPPIQNNTLKYEYIILPQKEKEQGGLAADGMILCDKNNKRLTLPIHTEDNHKRTICQELKKMKPSYFYSLLADLGFNHYITTNYELFLNQAFKERGFKNTVHAAEDRLYKHESFESNDRSVTIWNIHGDTDDEKSIMLGLSEYCNYVARIDRYLNSEDVKQGQSWINLLFNTNVHIVGLGMAYEEIDLWNVLVTRKRMQRKDETACTNHIYYYTIQDESFDLGKNQLLDALDVEVIDIDFDRSNDAYKNAYKDIYQRLSESLKS